MSKLTRCLLLLCLAPLYSGGAAHGAIPEDGNAGVILTYHRIGEDAWPDSNISTEQFRAHIAEIENGDYNVMPLPALLEAVRARKTLPRRTIALVFEGAFQSAYENAIPLLREKNIPFTVFYAAGALESGPYMTLPALKSLAADETVTLGVLPASYSHTAGLPETEIRRQVNKARAFHRESFGTEAAFFSYPFGEYTAAYKTIVEQTGFNAAFGLHSGAISPASDFFALPRFTLTEKYGDVERFRTAAETMPLPVSDIEPESTLIENALPVIGFSVPGYLAGSLKSLSCFVTGQPEPKVEILGNRVELRLAEEIVIDRARVNCTLPGPPDPENDTPTWRWFGLLLVNEGKAVETPIQESDVLP